MIRNYRWWLVVFLAMASQAMAGTMKQKPDLQLSGYRAMGEVTIEATGTKPGESFYREPVGINLSLTKKGDSVTADILMIDPQGACWVGHGKARRVETGPNTWAITIDKSMLQGSSIWLCEVKGRMYFRMWSLRGTEVYRGRLGVDSYNSKSDVYKVTRRQTRGSFSFFVDRAIVPLI